MGVAQRQGPPDLSGEPTRRTSRCFGISRSTQSPCIFCEGFFYCPMFYTYILYSESIDLYYTGYTSVGVDRRLARHNSGSSPSTKPGIPWKVTYVKSFEPNTEAYKCENFIMRKKIRRNIKKLL